MPRRHVSSNSAAPQPAPAPAPMPYGFYPPPPQFSYYGHPNSHPMQWAGPAGPAGPLAAGLPPPVPQQNPTAPQKHVQLEGPLISVWLQYCDRLPGRKRRNLSALASKFDDEGFETIDQLTRSRMSVENLSEWIGVSKGIADRIIQYADEDMALVGDGNFTMDLEPAEDRDWAEV
jgi:hypothetical protein